MYSSIRVLFEYCGEDRSTTRGGSDGRIIEYVVQEYVVSCDACNEMRSTNRSKYYDTNILNKGGSRN